jgi:hypothetical protein
MKPIIITPKDKAEFAFLKGLLNKLKVSARELTDEEIEDFGMSVLMKQADRSRKVSRESIMKKLAY